ncbi:hypothetical protein, partial [Streptomyces anulatus]|uniref:hypothetical protein n=1 Tax=Streptomyces anulatus TaxID=1892 RepID=UPI00364E8201
TFKGTTNLPKQAGVSTYLALTFGTLLSSQGTDASFGPVLPGPSGRFPSFFSLSCCLAFPTLSDSFVSDSRSKRDAFQVLRFRVFPFRRFQLYQTLFRSVSGPNLISGGLWSGLAFRRSRLYQRL